MKDVATLTKIYLEFDPLFTLAKQRTEMRSRSLPDEVAEMVLISNEYKESFMKFFQDGCDQFANQYGTFDQVKVYEDTMIFELTENQSEQGLKKITGMIEKAVLQYMLWAWYDNVGLAELAQNARSKYETYIRDVRNNVTRPASVTPKYRPYF